MALDVLQLARVAGEGAGGEERVVGWEERGRCVWSIWTRPAARLDVLVVAGEQLQAEELVVAGDEALDFVEDGEGIEGAERVRGCWR